MNEFANNCNTLENVKGLLYVTIKQDNLKQLYFFND